VRRLASVRRELRERFTGVRIAGDVGQVEMPFPNGAVRRIVGRTPTRRAARDWRRTNRTGDRHDAEVRSEGRYALEHALDDQCERHDAIDAKSGLTRLRIASPSGGDAPAVAQSPGSLGAAWRLVTDNDVVPNSFLDLAGNLKYQPDSCKWHCPLPEGDWLVGVFQIQTAISATRAMARKQTRDRAMRCFFTLDGSLRKVGLRKDWVFFSTWEQSTRPRLSG
jgi:hypothetical protein